MWWFCNVWILYSVGVSIYVWVLKCECVYVDFVKCVSVYMCVAFVKCWCVYVCVGFVMCEFCIEWVHLSVCWF